MIPGSVDIELAMAMSIPANRGAMSIKFGVAPEERSPSLPTPRVSKVTAVSLFLPKYPHSNRNKPLNERAAEA